VVLLLRLGVALPEPPLLALAICYRLVVSLADALAALTAAADTSGQGLARLRELNLLLRRRRGWPFPVSPPVMRCGRRSTTAVSGSPPAPAGACPV
jgi:hypothetical protein